MIVFIFHSPTPNYLLLTIYYLLLTIYYLLLTIYYLLLTILLLNFLYQLQLAQQVQFTAPLVDH